MRDGTAEPVARPNSQARTGIVEYYFPCSADHEQDWQPYPVDPYSAICDDQHTYILLRSIIIAGMYVCMDSISVSCYQKYEPVFVTSSITALSVLFVS